jgi:hypothetical protein
VAVLFKNPELPDYFVEVADLQIDTPLGEIKSIVEPYEAGKVMYFPKLKFDIDFDFWESLPTDRYPDLKRLSSLAVADPSHRDTLLDSKLANANLPPELESALRPAILRVYEQAIPIYERLFAEYKFVSRRVTWRLNTIHNENLHVDSYANEFEHHFARMFINLDCQPRIWSTSYRVDEMFERFGARIPIGVVRDGTRAKFWKELDRASFGGTAVWWDRQPRHFAYFDPGDAWIVDSRQVAHQIFYGRRAVSIDFFVDTATMLHPEKQYLRLAADFQRRAADAASVPA